MKKPTVKQDIEAFRLHVVNAKVGGVSSTKRTYGTLSLREIAIAERVLHAARLAVKHGLVK